MAGIFDSKIFNGEVFKGYIDRIPNPTRSEMVKSRAIRPRPDLAAAMADQDGGNFITTTMRGLISGSAPQNYDGVTDMQPGTTTTYKHSRVVVGRMNAWTEKDFAFDLTGGEDFLENVAQQIAEYWEEVDQGTLIDILTGVFAMTDEEGTKFVESHTHDVTAVQNSEGVTGKMDGTTLNTCMQKACGDNKAAFSLAIMHSAVATNLENLKLLAYLKYTDANGMQRDLSIGTLNGRVVLVDDSMPLTKIVTTAETKGVYTLTISTKGIADDKISVGGVEYTFHATETSFANKTVAIKSSAATQAAELKKVLAEQYAGIFNVTNTSGQATVVLTQVVGGTGAVPVVSVTQTASGTIAASIATTTSGVAEVDDVAYTTFVLGEGAIEYTDCGAKVPYEVDRDPKTNGGQDTLYSRQRKCFAPFGISFTASSMASHSPTSAELRNGANWELVNNSAASAKQYINTKSIPIARIISLG